MHRNRLGQFGDRLKPNHRFLGFVFLPPCIPMHFHCNIIPTVLETRLRFLKGGKNALVSGRGSVQMDCH